MTARDLFLVSSRTSARLLGVVVLALCAVVAVAQEGPEVATLRFGWTVPTSIGVTELADDAMEMHYVLVLEHAEAGLRVRTDDLRLVEFGGRAADHPAIAAQMAFGQAFTAGTRPPVHLGADGAAVGAPETMSEFAAMVDGLEDSTDPRAARAIEALRERLQVIRETPELVRALTDRALARWYWSVGAWVGLPLREGVVFEGDRVIASEIDGVSSTAMHATISASADADAPGRWTFVLSATDEAHTKEALAHGPLAAATAGKRTVEITALVDAESLRPRRITYVESLEASLPGEDRPRRRGEKRVLDFEWDPPEPEAGPTADDLEAVRATVETNMEAMRTGDAETLAGLSPPANRRSGPAAKLDPWPVDWTWEPFRQHLDGHWALAAVHVDRQAHGTAVWPILLHREDGRWHVLGQGFAPLEIGLVTRGMDPPAPRWLRPRFEDWIVEAMTDDPADEVVLGDEPRALEFGDGRSRLLWFELDSARRVEVRAESPDGAGPAVRVVLPSGSLRLSRGGTAETHVITQSLPAGSYGLRVSAEKAGTVLVSLSELVVTELELSRPAGPLRVEEGRPARFRVRLAKPREVVCRIVPVAGREGDAELVLDVATRSTRQSNQGGIVRTRAAGEVLLTVATLGEGAAECFLVVQDAAEPSAGPSGGTTASPSPALSIGDARDVSLPAGGAVLVRVEAPEDAAWTARWASESDVIVVQGSFREGSGGGVILASRGAALTGRIHIEATE